MPSCEGSFSCLCELNGKGLELKLAGLRFRGEGINVGSDIGA